MILIWRAHCRAGQAAPPSPPPHTPAHSRPPGFLGCPAMLTQHPSRRPPAPTGSHAPDIILRACVRSITARQKRALPACPCLPRHPPRSGRPAQHCRATSGRGQSHQSDLVAEQVLLAGRRTRSAPPRTFLPSHDASARQDSLSESSPHTCTRSARARFGTPRAARNVTLITLLCSTPTLPLLRAKPCDFLKQPAARAHLRPWASA